MSKKENIKITFNPETDYLNQDDSRQNFEIFIKKVNNQNFKSEENKKEKNSDIIRFNDYENNKKLSSIISNKQQSEISNTKSKRKSSILPIAQSTHLAFLESIKNLKDSKTYYGRYYFYIKICDFILGFLSFFSVLFSLIDVEIYLDKSKEYLHDIMKQKGLKEYEVYNEINKRKISSIENNLRIINILFCIISIIVVLIKYNIKIKILILDGLLSKYDSFFSSGLVCKFLIDLVINSIFFFPGVNETIYGTSMNIVYVYGINNIFLVTNLFKIYNCIKVVLHFSRFHLKISQTICKSHNVQTGLFFVIKSELNRNPIIFLTFLLIILIFVFSIISRGFENLAIDKIKGLNGVKGINDLQNYVNNFWLILTTVTKIGFGDEYPRTELGRLFIFLIFLIGMLSLGYCTASLSGYIEFIPVEKRAYLKLKKIFDPENNEHKAANLIKTILFMRKNIKNSKNILLMSKSDNLKEKICLYLKIRSEAVMFKNELYVARTYSMPMNDFIKTLETKLYDNLVSLTKQLDKINEVEIDFQNIEKEQKEIQKTLNKINYNQEIISNYLLEIHNKNFLYKKKKYNFKTNISNKYKKSYNIKTIHPKSKSPLMFDFNSNLNRKKFSSTKNLFFVNNKKKNQCNLINSLIEGENCWDLFNKTFLLMEKLNVEKESNSLESIRVHKNSNSIKNMSNNKIIQIDKKNSPIFYKITINNDEVKNYIKKNKKKNKEEKYDNLIKNFNEKIALIKKAKSLRLEKSLIKLEKEKKDSKNKKFNRHKYLRLNSKNKIRLSSVHSKIFKKNNFSIRLENSKKKMDTEISGCEQIEDKKIN